MILTLFVVRLDCRVRHVPQEGTTLVKGHPLFNQGRRTSTPQRVGGVARRVLSWTSTLNSVA